MKNSQDIAHRFEHRPRSFQRAYDIRPVSFQRTLNAYCRIYNISDERMHVSALRMLMICCPAM
jgi:hypothetical protein